MWDNPKDYEYTEALSHSQWAWEFLRRNPEYRETWRRWLGARNELGTSVDATEAFQEFAKWGLNAPHDPAIQAGPDRAGRSNAPLWLKALYGGCAGVIRPEISVDDYRAKFCPDAVAVLLDPRHPIDDQWKQARAYIVKARDLVGQRKLKPRTMTHQTNWPIYLMALDARDDLAGSLFIDTCGLSKTVGRNCLPAQLAEQSFIGQLGFANEVIVSQFTEVQFRIFEFLAVVWRDLMKSREAIYKLLDVTRCRDPLAFPQK